MWSAQHGWVKGLHCDDVWMLSVPKGLLYYAPKASQGRVSFYSKHLTNHSTQTREASNNMQLSFQEGSMWWTQHGWMKGQDDDDVCRHGVNKWLIYQSPKALQGRIKRSFLSKHLNQPCNSKLFMLLGKHTHKQPHKEPLGLLLVNTGGTPCEQSTASLNLRIESSLLIRRKLLHTFVQD